MRVRLCELVLQVVWVSACLGFRLSAFRRFAKRAVLSNVETEIIWSVPLYAVPLPHIRRVSSTFLQSSKSSNPVMQQILPRDGYKEDGGEEGSADARSVLTLLDSKIAPTVTVSAEELQPRWIDVCIEQKRPNDMDSFCLQSALPLLLREDSVVIFRNKTAEADPSAEVYVTEIELRRLWAARSQTAMGKGLDKFNIEEALLLLSDQEDEALLEDGEGEGERGGDEGEVVEDEEEYFITTQELRRVWDERASVRWGLPAAEFDEQLAFLLIDDDDDDDTVYRSYIDLQTNAALPASSGAVTLSTDTLTGTYEELGISPASLAEYSSDADEGVRDAIFRIHADLEDRTYQRPAWRKDRHILTPDIDTQRFLGDIMLSNTYMTQRIPANWNDPEMEEMSETYLSTGSMAMPDEEETDFNLKVPIWERLGLSLPPIDADGEGEGGEGQEGDAEGGARRSVIAEAVTVDWATFDFGAADNQRALGEGEGDDEESDEEDEGEDEDDYDENDYVDEEEEASASEEDVFNEVVGPLQKPEEPRQKPPFVTPKAWLEKPRFAQHVGFETWSQYPVDWFYGADDAVWDEDVFLKQSIEHVLNVTNEYLVDHLEESRSIDDYRYWERVLFHKLTGNGEVERDKHTKQPVLDANGAPWIREEIPIYLTPDKPRGVEYSDEIIEMKSKMTLHVALPPPAILFENDTFTHNTDFETMNKIGTIREQYDWQPDKTLLPYVIDATIAERVQPVIDYVNHAARLRSTKDGVLVFEYYGQIRHVIGIRESMSRIARECWPEMKSLRLETRRTSDKFDSSSVLTIRDDEEPMWDADR